MRNRPGVRRDHGRLRHFDYQKPLRRKTRRSIGRRDPGSLGAPKQVGDNGCFVQRFKGCQRRTPKRRAGHFITDARHFAAVRGARTRLERSTFMRIVELLPGGLERCTEKFAKGLHAILNDVL